MLDTVRMTQRNVKHWSSGEMGLRWTAAGMLEAERQFRNVIGYTDVPRLAVAIERPPSPTPRASRSFGCGFRRRSFGSPTSRSKHGGIQRPAT